MSKPTSKRKKIICLGGGNAMPKAVLVGLKKHPVKIAAICAMLDSGGSSGRLRRDYNIVSPGDIRRAILALSNTSPAMESLFEYRFQGGDLKGHNFANLLIAALELSGQDYEKTIKEVSRLLNVKHQVLPATLEKANIHAVLSNNQIIKGEANIDVPKHDGNLKIKNVYLEPKVKAYPKAKEAIKKADLVVIGPGDLYSSLAQILLTEGIAETIKESSAKKAYICNLMTKYGETNDFSVLDFSKEIEKYLGDNLDFVIYNTKEPEYERLSSYKEEHPELLDLVRIDENLPKGKFIGADILIDQGDVVHDSEKLAKIILSI